MWFVQRRGVDDRRYTSRSRVHQRTIADRADMVHERRTFKIEAGGANAARTQRPQDGFSQVTCAPVTRIVMPKPARSVH
jgi:hypothetical protein